MLVLMLVLVSAITILYLFRKSIYLEDYQEDRIFSKVQDNSENFVNIDRYAVDFEKAVKILEKVKKNVEKISDVALTQIYFILKYLFAIFIFILFSSNS